VKLWDVSTGRLSLSLLVPGRCPLLPTFTPDGRELILASEGVVKRYELGGRTVCRPLLHQGFALHHMTASADGSRLVTVARGHTLPDGTPRTLLTCWAESSQGRVEQRTFEGTGDAASLPAPTLSADGKVLAWAASGSELRVRFEGREEELTMDVPGLRAMAVSPTGERVWAAAGNLVKSWSLPDGKPQSEWAAINTAGIGQVYTVAVGRRWALGGARDGRVHVFDAATGKHRTTWAGPGGVLASLALIGDGEHAILGTEAGRLRVVRLPEGKPFEDLPAHRDGVEGVALDGTGALLATGSRDRTVRLWRREPDGYELLLTLRPLTSPVRSLWLSPDGRRLWVLLDGEGGIRSWDLEELRTRCADLGIGWTRPAAGVQIATALPARTD
jgi:WD40 repeat protein